ncbi:MAG: acyl-protein synthetase [Succinatimonas sp.]|nr:acyl-protein synthetase [Succinatimonas sp.]
MESIDKISVMLEELFKIAPYSLDQAKKEEIITPILKELTSLHYHNCKEFQKIVDTVFNLNDDRDFYQQNNGEASVGEFANIKSLSDVPFIPVRLFKLFELLSVPKEDVCKILTSSGTSSQVKSKIFLDKLNLLNQTKTLNHIITSFLGSSRLPMVIFDTSMIRKDRTMFSARGGGVIGFSLFGRKPIYALDDNMELDIDSLETFFKEHQDERVIFFGYTFMIWQYIVKVLEEKKTKFNFKNAVLFHTGGWKKLQSEAVEPKAFIERVKNVLGNVEVYNQYGMAEQLGSVYIECEYGHMHPSNFSDVIIRRAKDFRVADVGEKGLMQLVSVIQTSYPGHSILTEDQGMVLGIDNCPCGRKGKFFKILGRIKNAELRGCSDTFSK